MDPLPSVTHAFSLVKQDEKQRQGYLPSHSDDDSLATVGRNVNLGNLKFKKRMLLNLFFHRLIVLKLKEITQLLTILRFPTSSNP